MKDLDLERRELVVRGGKGGRDRISVILVSLMATLNGQIAARDGIHQRPRGLVSDGRVAEARPIWGTSAFSRSLSCKLLPWAVTYSTGKIRRGGYVFVTWAGDHSPCHLHVYRDGILVLKWDLENDAPMKGKGTRRVLRLITELREEGKL